MFGTRQALDAVCWLYGKLDSDCRKCLDIRSQSLCAGLRQGGADTRRRRYRRRSSLTCSSPLGCQENGKGNKERRRRAERELHHVAHPNVTRAAFADGVGMHRVTGNPLQEQAATGSKHMLISYTRIRSVLGHLEPQTPPARPRATISVRTG